MDSGLNVIIILNRKVIQPQNKMIGFTLHFGTQDYALNSNFLNTLEFERTIVILRDVKELDVKKNLIYVYFCHIQNYIS